MERSRVNWFVLIGVYILIAGPVWDLVGQLPQGDLIIIGIFICLPFWFARALGGRRKHRRERW